MFFFILWKNMDIVSSKWMVSAFWILVNKYYLFKWKYFIRYKKIKHWTDKKLNVNTYVVNEKGSGKGGRQGIYSVNNIFVYKTTTMYCYMYSLSLVPLFSVLPSFLTPSFLVFPFLTSSIAWPASCCQIQLQINASVLSWDFLRCSCLPCRGENYTSYHSKYSCIW